MITPHEQEQIQLLSDTELYPQAVEFIHGMGKTLPPTQINGLLNVSLADTYEHFKEFIKSQYARTTWRRGDEHIPDFYRRLETKRKQLEGYAQDILKARAERPAQEDILALYMLITREFIQHILAENAYVGAQRAWQYAGQDNRGNKNNQGGRSGQGSGQGNNRGPMTQQGRA